MANINTYRKELVEAIEKVDEARGALTEATNRANKAWQTYREIKNKKQGK